MYNFRELFERDGLQYVEIGNAQIPPMIHRIWVGNAITTSSFQNLLDFQKKLSKRSRGNYVQILWTTHSTAEKMKNAEVDQLKLLQDAGYSVNIIEDLLEGGKHGEWDRVCLEIIMCLMRNGSGESYKFVSDLFRMYILYCWGGIYMDVDIGIGCEDFNGVFYHRYRFPNRDNAYMPLIGSNAPFEVIKNFTQSTQEERYQREKENFKDGSYAWNYFFATVGNNEVIKDILLKMISEKTDAQTCTIYMIDLFFESLGMAGNAQGQQGALMARALFTYAFAPLELQYATRASETS